MQERIPRKANEKEERGRASPWLPALGPLFLSRWIGRRRVFPWLQGLAFSPLIPRYPFHFSFHICLSFLWISGSVALHMHWKSSKQQCQHLSILVLSISQALGNHLIKFLGPSLAITRSAYFLDHNNRLQLCSYVSQKKKNLLYSYTMHYLHTQSLATLNARASPCYTPVLPFLSPNKNL